MCGPLCSVPPAGVMMVVVPDCSAAFTSVQVSSSSCTLGGGARAGPTAASTRATMRRTRRTGSMTEKLERREHRRLTDNQHDDPFQNVDLVRFQLGPEASQSGPKFTFQFDSEQTHFVAQSRDV